jgi:hypothetical protein
MIEKHSPGYWTYRANVANSLELMNEKPDLGSTEQAIVFNSYRHAIPCKNVAIEIRFRRQITAIIPHFYAEQVS